ncbi:NUDIX hydrolase [Streptomyces sp. NPDC047981]|uniref:NUDIX hydrolase n=1 Tax=Streptomyces sp. NPDC047981 TaxID=3154610 RepID=UPI0034173BAD
MTPPQPRQLPLIGVAAVITNDAGEYLLHLRDNIPGIANPGTWSLIGGHIDEGEQPEQAMERELLEEAGIEDCRMDAYLRIRNQSAEGVSTGLIQTFTGRWEGSAKNLPVTEGIMFHFFPPAMLPRLVVCPWADSLLHEHAQNTSHGKLRKAS